MAAIVAIAMVVGSLLTTATPAFAVVAGTGSLTVKGNDAFASVDAYQMFVVQGDTEGSAKYVLNGAWNDFFTKDNLEGFPETVAEGGLSDAAFTYIKGLGESDTAGINAFAKKAAAWAADDSHGITATNAKASGDPKTATLSDLAFGYYLVVPNPKGSTPDTDHQNRGTDAMLVNVSQSEQTMELKTVYPTVEKKVNNDNHASASVGDTLNFTLTSTVPDTSEYTDSYQFAFEDTLSKGLTFGNITSITIGETTLNAGTDYKLTQTVDDGTGETKLRIDFGTESGGIYNAKDLFDGKAGQKITVTYTATLNENAVVADGTDADNINTVKVVYSNNPTTDGTGESGNSTTHQYTFGFDLNKTDGTNGLGGAQFQLKKGDGVIRLIAVAGQENTYRPAKAGESEGVVDTVTTPEGGVIHFTGLAAGTYQLVETAAPEGYNRVTDPIEVKIEATYNDDGTLDTWTVNKNGHNAVEVVNHAGTLLPGTGGIGTVVFTVAGAAIVIAGAAWYISRRKQQN